MSNALVVAPINTATPFSGTGLLESGVDLSNAISSGSWVEGGMAAFSVGIDTVAAAMDPLGSLISAGLGWLMDHFEPLKGWFNDLTGDAGEVAAFAQTWTNIQTQLNAAGVELMRVVADIDDLHGEAMDAYRRFQSDVAQHLQGAATWAGSMSTGLQIASTIVQLVHDLVRDVISDLVGSAISWAAQVVFSFGLATPWVVSQVSTRVASLSAKVSTKLTALLSSAKKLSGLLDELKALLKNAADLFDKMLPGGSSTPRPPRTPGTPDPTVPHVRPGESLPDELRDDILALPNGARPEPDTYLSPEYIAAHRAEFEGGGTRFMTETNLNKYGPGQSDGTSFIMPTSEIDELLSNTGGDLGKLEEALGLPPGFFDDGGIVRVDIPEASDLGIRVPSGNEAGANSQWIPGGHLPTGVTEGVIDIPPGGGHQVIVTPMEGT